MKSKYNGVYRNTENTKWWSKIAKDGKDIYLGSFDTEEEALEVYKKAKLEYRRQLCCVICKKEKPTHQLFKSGQMIKICATCAKDAIKANEERNKILKSLGSKPIPTIIRTLYK